MKHKDKTLGYHRDAGDAEEVEILEVVGVDDDDAPVSATETPRLDDEEGRDDEIVFALDDEDGADDVTLGASEAALSDTAESRSRVPPRDTGGTSELGDQELIQRLRADYDNLRKRVDRERREFELNANASLIAGLLPVLDNFERALGVEVQPGADSAFHEGLRMIFDHLNRCLLQEGLKPIDSVGCTFDPTLHDAVATELDPDVEHNTIVEELQRGYLFQDRVLRPAMVKVCVKVEAAEAEAETHEDDGEDV